MYSRTGGVLQQERHCSRSKARARQEQGRSLPFVVSPARARCSPAPSAREFCHFTDTPSPSLLEHLLTRDGRCTVFSPGTSRPCRTSGTRTACSGPVHNLSATKEMKGPCLTCLLHVISLVALTCSGPATSTQPPRPGRRRRRPSPTQSAPGSAGEACHSAVDV